YFYGSNHTPKWASTSSLVKCCKTFIMILTDGEPTQDTNIPSTLKDYGHAAHGTHCTGGSTTIHTANGTCNTNTATPPANLIAEHKTDYGSSGNHYLDDVAYWAHINDLRPCSGNIAVINVAGHCVEGVQTATVYAFFTFGNIAGREILMKTAKLGGFEDSNGNSLPDLTSEWDKVNNLTGAAGADGIPDTFFESANVDDLEARLLAAISSMLGHAASGTAISVLATSATGDGAVYQSYFFPVSDEGTVWTGYTQGLFIDELGNLREDTDGDHRLIYTKDNIVVTYFDTTTNDSKVHRFADTDGDGIADSTTPVSVGGSSVVDLRDMSPLWEAGKQLALKSAGSRKIFTWVDSNGDKVVTATEQIAFDSTNVTALTPYLRGDTTGIFTAANIVEYIRGTQIDGMRNRLVQVPRKSGTSYVWKLGDSVHATPTVIGAPRERYDVIYGDASYTAFFQKYKNRRQVAYVGANDGMIHAFNGGYFHKGDDPSTTSVTEHGYFTKNATDDSSGAALGDELWAFIPQELLPHLRWLTQPDYQHIYYVDLKPKVTDVRIFSDDATHPGGWGTILIAGFGLGGSCGDTTSGTACKPMAVSATFSGGTQSTRNFYSAYVVLDITDPEQNPVLLWSFSQADLGYTTSFPAIMRLKPACTAANCKVDKTDAKWYMVAGSGPTDYIGSSTQTAKMFAVDLQAGPVDASTGTSLVATFSTGDANAFMGDGIAVDAQLDYRMDAVYMGSVINNGTASPSWLGKLYRLTTKQGSTSTADWGVLSGGARVPSVILSTFASDTGATLKVGPVSAAPNLSADDTNNLWVFFGTGRLYTSADKTNTDPQYFLGVKDPIVSGGSCTETATPPASPAGCRTDDLVNVTNVSVCTVCGSGSQVTGAGTGITSLLGTDASTTLQGKVQSKSGWYTALTGTYERVLASPTLSGGAIFFPTFIPTTSASTDICTTEAGSGKIYALYYKTGSAYKASIIGTEAGSIAGTTVASKSVSLGKGMASQFAVHIGAQGKGAVGTLVQASGDGSITSQTTTGSEGRITIIDQNSLGGTNKISAAAPLASWSRMLSWISQRD
nr:hypothetical protein [Nitrospirota bacterium]